MINFWQSRHWQYPALFLGLALLFLFIRLLPSGDAAGRFPGPDLLLCMIMAWVMRRPDYLPLGLILAVVLVEDLVLLRPPGLWTALVVLATEFIRSRVELTRELNFVTEWLLVSGLMIGMLLIYRLTFAIALLPQPAFGYSVVQVLWSIAAYPLVVVVSRLVLDLRKPATGETDDFGRRL